MRYYDKVDNRLIWIRAKATASYWADQWEIAGINPDIYKPSSYVSRITSKYMRPADGPILEAGCGRANHVYALVQQGYSVTGIDFAERTVAEVKKIVPDLDVRKGDVLHLPFEDESFAGYWSLGLIEHFWGGYDQLAKESFRVLKPGGHAFYTFPYLSPLRQLKVSLSRYSAWPENDRSEPDDFYQFSLHKNTVQKRMQEIGFQVIGVKGLDGIKGFKSEVKSVAPLLQKAYDYRGRSTLIRGGRYLLSEALSLFSGHSILLVLKKPISSQG